MEPNKVTNDKYEKAKLEADDADAGRDPGTTSGAKSGAAHREKYEKYNGNVLMLEYKYKCPIEEVWINLKNMIVWKTVQRHFTNFQLIKGKNCYDIGAQYSFYYKNYLMLTYETLEVEEEEYTKRILTECIGNSSNNVRYIFEYKLFKNTLENNTYMTYTLTYNIEMDFEISNMVRLEKHNLFRINSKKNKEK